MFVRLCARETKWLTKCWSKLSLLTNHTVYEKLVYRNEVLKAMLKDSTTPSLPNLLAVFTQIFSIRFPHYLRAWKRLQVVLFFICISLHSCRFISCVICKRRGRHLSGLYFYISVGTHNNVINRRTWSVVFAAVLATRKCFWLWISKTEVFYRETWTKWNISFKIGAKIELKVFFSAVSQFHLWVYFCPLCVHIGSMFRFGSLLLTQLA